MALTTMKELLVTAQKEKYAVGSFEFWSLDSAQAIIHAAETENVPVILQAGKIECDFCDGVKYLAQIAQIAAADAKVPVALHLDHATDYDFICEAINAGFTSVMIDASMLPFEENVKITRKVVETASRTGVTVEAELGKLSGNEGTVNVSEEEANQTDPKEAARFVEQTGVDALAVAIGTAHGFYTFTPKINIQRLIDITKEVSIPLVLHGGSGTPEKDVQEAVKHGIAKVNICTELVAAFGKTYIKTQAPQDFKYTIPNLFGPSKEAGYQLALEKIRLFKGL